LFTNEQLRNEELKASKRGAEYFRSPRKKDRHKLDFKTRH